MAKLKTGRHTSALKELRKTVKRNKQNTSKKTFLKTLVKNVLAAVEKKDKQTANEVLNKAFSAFDKAAKTNTIHANKAARKKSQLSKKVATLEL